MPGCHTSSTNFVAASFEDEHAMIKLRGGNLWHVLMGVVAPLATAMLQHGVCCCDDRPSHATPSCRCDDALLVRPPVGRLLELQLALLPTVKLVESAPTATRCPTLDEVRGAIRTERWARFDDATCSSGCEIPHPLPADAKHMPWCWRKIRPNATARDGARSASHVHV